MTSGSRVWGVRERAFCTSKTSVQYLEGDRRLTQGSCDYSSPWTPRDVRVWKKPPGKCKAEPAETFQAEGDLGSQPLIPDSPGEALTAPLSREQRTFFIPEAFHLSLTDKAGSGPRGQAPA